MSAENRDVPVIAIDGPSGSGKGTIARRVATELGWHLLDSGALYRLVARVMNTDLPVLISGESGTGKSLIARAIPEETL